MNRHYSGTAAEWEAQTEVQLGDPLADVSPDFYWHPKDARVARRLLALEASPRAIQYFAQVQAHLSHYAYWYLLGTLWVSYSGWSDLRLWRRLFQSPRPLRDTSLMKPSEMAVWLTLPETLTVWRAHRSEETDWISYTLDRAIAERLLSTRPGGHLACYRLPKTACLSLFLRRGEQEVLMLDPKKAEVLLVGEGS